MKSEVRKLKNKIETWDSTLENEASWLFVGTLSVWSVHQLYFQLAASLILLFFFVTRVEKASEVRSDKGFNREILDLEESIKKSADSESLECIAELKLRNSAFAHFKNAKVYFISFFAWLASTLYFSIDLLK